ncbi:conserved hypothetical protein [Ricinus communis]|uniref:Uncharacterized protein n=1 Tax=Ricinus communis TaxID=3988 RepID=B9RL63_RICCO|nr:conserved hypothetical protein [Ricinus communis]
MLPANMLKLKPMFLRLLLEEDPLEVLEDEDTKDYENNKSHDPSDSDDDLVDGKDVETEMDEDPIDIDYSTDYLLPRHLSLSPPIKYDDIEPHMTKSLVVILHKPPASLCMAQDISSVPEFADPLSGLNFFFLAATSSLLSTSLTSPTEATVKFAKQTLHQLTLLELLTLNKDEQ